MRLTTFAVLAVAAAAVVAVPTASSAAESPVVLVAETEAGIVQLDLDTGAVLRLLVPGGHSPDVSPDGQRLVFGLSEGNAQHLWTSDLDGSLVVYDQRRRPSGLRQLSSPAVHRAVIAESARSPSTFATWTRRHCTAPRLLRTRTTT